MGLAASQARLLLLTARKSDLELRAQQITNSEMMLAMQTESIAKEYSNKISNRQLKMQVANNQMNGDLTTSIPVTVADLKGHDYELFDKEGNRVPDELLPKNTFDLHNQIKRGQLVIHAVNKETRASEGAIDLNGGDGIFFDTYYTDDDASATADYESKTSQIQTKEKQLEIDLKQIENQQKACDTEIDSVKKIIDKNIERTFKTFA